MSLDPLKQRQLELGAASFFRPETEDPPGNQIIVKAGFGFRGAFDVIDQFTGGDQTTAGFASVSGAAFKRYDLVYINATGVVAILAGNEVAVASPQFDGAPGFNLGPDLPDQAVPVAYVLVDEVGAVTVNTADMFQVTGFISISRDLNGYQVDKGLLGGAPSGLNDVVTTIFSADTPGGSSTQRGVVTAPPLNFVTLVDQDGNELIRTADGSQVYGRLTEAAGVWTLTSFANVAGTETAVDVDTDITTSPTDIKLIGVPVVFSQNDPARPLFPDSVARLSDLAAADIPPASLTVAGKAKIASDGSTVAADTALATNDGRTGAVKGRANAGAVSGFQQTVRLIQAGTITVSLIESGGELQFTIGGGGGGGPSFGVTGDMQQDGSADIGSTGTVPHSNHVHPTSSVYTNRDGLRHTYAQFSAATNLTTGALGYNPRCGIWIGTTSGDDFWRSFGLFNGTGAGNQHCIYGGANTLDAYQTSTIARSSQNVGANLGRWPVSQFTSAGVIANRTIQAGTPSATLSGGMLVLGDNI